MSKSIRDKLGTALKAIDPQTFENLIYDILQAEGLKNVVWRTPGPDGGRDAEGMSYIYDISGYHGIEKWHIECKKYASAIDWPTIFSKLSYAISNSADYLLIATTSSPSPSATNEIAKWNQNYFRPRIRCWALHDIVNYVLSNNGIHIKYFYETIRIAHTDPFIKLSLYLNRLIQNFYAGHSFAIIPDFIIDAISSLSELLYARSEDIKQEGKIIYRNTHESDVYDWVEYNNISEISKFDQQGIRALLSCIRYITKSKKISLISSTRKLNIKFDGLLEKRQHDDINTICFWSNFTAKYSETEITVTENERKSS
jgi:hypothetical protein